MLKLMGQKIFKILRSKILLFWPYIAIVMCPHSSTVVTDPLLSTGSTQEDPFRHD